MRAIVTLLHRWAGLTIAAFLSISGATGAIISWNHELDEWLNPHLSIVEERGSAINSVELARRIEAKYPQVRVTSIPLAAAEGDSISFLVSPRVDPKAGQLFEPGFNQVFVNPITGAEMGKRMWGSVWPITRENLMSFLYLLHFSLHTPALFGIEQYQLGIWLLGIIAVVWIFDCFFGFYLTLPIRKVQKSARVSDAERKSSKGFLARWRPAWKVKTAGSRYRVSFDIHRAFGLWTWVALFILAVSGASLNLYKEVARPLVTLFSSFTPLPHDLRAEQSKEKPIEPQISWQQLVDKARMEGARRKWDHPLGNVSYSEQHGIYGAKFFELSDEYGIGGVGSPELYYDAADGHLLGDRIPLQGTAGDIFLQGQFPLHSGRIAGLPGRIFISFMGFTVAVLSVTGIIIWYRKRWVRNRSELALLKRRH